MLLYAAFGWEPPVWAHLPVILNPNGKGKMSKRYTLNEDGTSVPVHLRDYIADGYISEAMVNFLANIGWSIDGSREVFTPEEAMAAFSIDGINPSPAAFPYDKLVWLDGVYIRELDDEDLYRRLLPFVARGVGMSEAEMAARPELRPAADMIILEACAAIRERWPRQPVGYQIFEADTPRCPVPKNRFGIPLI